MVAARRPRVHIGVRAPTSARVPARPRPEALTRWIFLRCALSGDPGESADPGGLSPTSRESDVRTMARASLRSGPCCNVHIHAVLTTSAPPPRAGSILAASPCSS